MLTHPKQFGIMTIGAAIGLTASFWQMLEKLTLLKNKDAVLNCNLNSVFSCSNVLNAWQSSVFGFPNSLMCIILFTIFLSMGLVGLSGGNLPRRLRLAVQALSFFTLGFGLWFLWQSTYRIGALCIFCIFCFFGLILINAMWLRVNAADLPLNAQQRKKLQVQIAHGVDIFGWTLLAAIIAFAMLFRFS